MINDFDKQFLKESLFKDIVVFQQYFERPSLIGLIQLDNCLDCSSLDNFVQRKYNIGNFHRSHSNFKHYQQRFHHYLELLGDDTIYPSKELFLSLLYINKKYDFLNFAPHSERDSRYIKEENGDITIVTPFEIKDYSTMEEKWGAGRKYHTRIKKGNVIRFFNRKLTDSKHFDDRSCYLTLTSDGISDEDFDNAFNAKHYRLSTMDTQHPIEFVVHDFIKKMIELGKEFDQLNPTEANYTVRREERSFEAEREIELVLDTEFGAIICDDFDRNIKSYEKLEVGDIIFYDNINYKIKEIKSLRTTLIKVIVEKADK